MAVLLLAGCATADRSAGTAPTSTAPTSSAPTSSAPTTAAPAAACAGNGVAERRTSQYLSATGADADLTTLEVITPRVAEGCGPAPVMIWVHGGGWRTGDRRNQLERKVDLFTSMGWTLVSVNYRLSPQVTYPVHNDDVAAAVDWVLDRSEELGIDPGRLSVMGHSAGAGIAAGVASDPAHLTGVGRSPADVRCVVYLDTEGYDVEAAAGRGVPIYLDAFGEDPEVWRAASPVRNVAEGGGTPRSLVVTRGGEARRATAALFVDALESAGADATLLDARPLDHAQVNAAVGAPDDQVVTPTLVEFLADC
jgi:acetyl esterase/lipase